MTRTPRKYASFGVAVELVVLTVRDGSFEVLVVERGVEPFCGWLELPGGSVHIDEDLPDAAVRELAEETGIRRPAGHLEQLATYGRPDRDPRMRVVSVAYLVLAPNLPDPVAGTDAAASRFLPVDRLPRRRARLAFDHGAILCDGVERARAKLEYSSLATAFCPPEFTVGELRAVYEAVWGATLDPRNFHRKVTGTPGFLHPTGQTTTRGGGRPAQLFTRGRAMLLNPPILRG